MVVVFPESFTLFWQERGSQHLTLNATAIRRQKILTILIRLHVKTIIAWHATKWHMEGNEASDIKLPQTLLSSGLHLSCATLNRLKGFNSLQRRRQLIKHSS